MNSPLWLPAEFMDMEEGIKDGARHPSREDSSRWDDICKLRAEVFPQSTAANNIQRWRKAVFFINACNRIRFVLKSDKPYKEKAEQDINANLEEIGDEVFKQTNDQFSQFGSLDDLFRDADEFSSADLDEIFGVSSAEWITDDAMETGISDPSSTAKGIKSLVAGPAPEEGSRAQLPDPTFRSTAEELLRNFRIIGQFASTDGKLSFVLESVGRVEPGKVQKLMTDVRALFERSMDPEWSSSIPMMVLGQNAAPMPVPGPMTKHVPTAVRDPRVPVSQVGDTSWNWTFSENTTIQESDDGIGSVQYDQESRGSSDLDSQLKSLRRDQRRGHWEKLVSGTREQIELGIGQFDHQSERTKMLNMKKDVGMGSTKLQNSLKKFNKHTEIFFEELGRCIGKSQSSMQTIDRFRHKALKQFVCDVDCVVSKLGKVASELDFHQMSATKLCQSMACKLSVLIENFLEGQGSNFISVAAFSDWYESLYSLHHLRGGS